MFTRRFQKSEKISISENFNGHPLFNAIQYACQVYENQMATLRLSPEEIFFEIADIIDRLLHSDFPDEYIENLWDILTANLRRTNTTVTEEEILMSVAIVLDCTFVILRLAHNDEASYFADEIIDVVHQKYDNDSDLENTIIDKVCNYSKNLCPWIEDYIYHDVSLSSEILNVVEKNSTRDGFLRPDRDISFISTSIYTFAQAEEKIYYEFFTAKSKVDAIRRIYSLQTLQILNMDGLKNDEERAKILNKYQNRFVFLEDDFKAARRSQGRSKR